MIQMEYRRFPVQRMNVNIDMKKTGAHIRSLIQMSGYTLQEIMTITGITAVQTLYKWFNGKSLPSLETQILLCRLFNIDITELLVVEGIDRTPADAKSISCMPMDEDRRERLMHYVQGLRQAA